LFIEIISEYKGQLQTGFNRYIIPLKCYIIHT